MKNEELLKIIANHLNHIDRGAQRLDAKFTVFSVSTYRMGSMVRIDIKGAIPEEQEKKNENKRQ